MKLLNILLLTILGSYINAQVVIGTEETNVINMNLDKVALTFNTDNMAIILPIIKSAAETADIIQPGAIFVSVKDKRVKIYNKSFESNLLWLTNPLSAAVPVDASNENTSINNVVFGNQNNVIKGVLVLENNNKTLVLPKIGDENRPPHKYIKNPYIGTIGFADTKNYTNPTSPLRKFIWVYGGSGNGAEDNEWHLWRSGIEMPVLTTNLNQAYLDNLPN